MLNAPADVSETADERTLVLIGGGHAHAHVLKAFGMRLVPDLRVVLITRDLETPYSGMIPGRIAGSYSHDECHIDLVRLARATGVTLIHAAATGLDPERRLVHCAGRPPIAFDIASIDIGSTPGQTVPGAAEHTIPVKPIEPFLVRWEAIAANVERTGDVPRIAVVGGGAGGVELTLAVHEKLTAALAKAGRSGAPIPLTLVTRGELLDRFGARARRLLAAELARKGVTVLTHAPVDRVEPGELVCADGRRVAFDRAIWVTWASAASWLRDTGLALDENGFIAVDACLRSISHPVVFAAGDVAAVLPHPREKAGVYAVRQGPPLAGNLRRALLGQPIKPFRPQKRALALIGTGDGRAVAVRGPLAFEGRLVWRWKQFIDRRWMRAYQDLRPRPMRPPPAMEDMRCGGCGAKVPADVLARVLDRLGIAAAGLDDAAVLELPPGGVPIQTVDHFRAFTDDPFVFGRIAANHALGDIHAMGGRPLAALAIASLPPPPARMEEDLFQMLAGALSVLGPAGARLVGGHSGEGLERALGFAVTGTVSPDLVLRKSGLRPGDRLILTKPLGTGAILAADMRGLARARWLGAALDSMQASSGEAAAILVRHGAHACTDVTGFGLHGHLDEMLRASGCAARLEVGALPILPGAAELLDSGIVSTLHGANLRAAALPDDPAPRILFDPQTAGGLLAGVPADAADVCLAALHASGYGEARAIGVVTAARQDGVRIAVA